MRELVCSSEYVVERWPSLKESRNPFKRISRNGIALATLGFAWGTSLAELGCSAGVQIKVCGANQS